MYDKATVFKIRWPIVTHWEFFDHFFNYVPFVIMPVPAEAAPSQAGAGRLLQKSVSQPHLHAV